VVYKLTMKVNLRNEGYKEDKELFSYVLDYWVTFR